MYRFHSFAEYRALLSLYNIGVEKIEGNNQGHKYTGLVYSALDADGNRVGKPLKSSLFGKSVGVEALERWMEKSKTEVKTKGIAVNTRALVSASLASSRTGSEFRAELRGKNIDLVLRCNDQGRLYGVTFIDYNSRTVLNGSTLGKEFSANAIGVRFADISLSEAHGEDVKPTAPALPTESSRLIIQPAQNDMQPMYEKGHTWNNLPVGDLLSVLTPEPDQHDGNQAAPARRKKKKRRYGRQM